MDYRAKTAELEAYLTGYWLTDLANFSAFVFQAMPRLNWAGFYLFDGTRLRLGPFVGKPACTEIRPGRGVCGTSFSQRTPLIVPNVDEFPGHIVCDGNSRSEMVLPLVIDGECVGVLDLDSPDLDRFSDADREGLAPWVSALLAKCPAMKTRPWA